MKIRKFFLGALVPAFSLALFAEGDVTPVESLALFDGKTLEGWVSNEGVWRVQDGAITAGSHEKDFPRNEFICTEKSYGNFELTLKIKCSGDLETGQVNSGIQIRSARLENGSVAGYQVDCGKGWFGKIFDEHRRRLLYPNPLNEEALLKAVDTFGWNDYRILAEGPRIRVWINEVLATDYTEENPLIPLNGIIAPQIHKGGHVMVQFKEVLIRELPPTEGAPTWESLGGPEAALEKVVVKKPKRGKRKPKAKAKPAPKAEPKEEVPAKEGASLSVGEVVLVVNEPVAKEKVDPAESKKKKYDWDGTGKKDTSYNNVQGQVLPASEQLKRFSVAEGYEIELVAQESEGIGKFVSVYFDQQGRMWTQTALEYPVDSNENKAAAEALYRSQAKDQVLVYPRESLVNLPEEGLTNPTVFADGLAIPLGLLPWGKGDSAYVLHGPELILLTDTDGDGEADEREVLLTGMGIQDSHLFPHQFTRAPGNWIWMAQGLFNNSAVKRPGEEESVAWQKCSMARIRPDGSAFEVTSTGPNNIWGLAIAQEGEAFIQEANDFGYPVMAFHEFAYYPGGMRALTKTYQPSFPPPAEFRMGGTGLSGLALLENGPMVDAEAQFTMLAANAITSEVQTLGMSREGAGWKLELLSDFITCEDPFFRPVGMTQGPDGYLYVVDWYNKIISHNEVPRNHPDRDKTRGRIWRIKPKGGEVVIPDFTALSDEELIAMMGENPTARAHLAWQTLADRASGEEETQMALKAVLSDAGASDAKKIQALWALNEPVEEAASLVISPNRNVRREAIRAGFEALELVDDPDSEVRYTALTELGRQLPENAETIIPALLGDIEPSLSEPTVISSRTKLPIPSGVAYEREFERYLVRLFLEQHPQELEAFLDTEAARALSVEGQIWGSLALPPAQGAGRVAELLGELDRLPSTDELLRLAEYPEVPACGEALRKGLQNADLREDWAAMLLTLKTRLDPKKVSQLLTEPTRELLASDGAMTGVKLAGAFSLRGLEPELLEFLKGERSATEQVALLKALAVLESNGHEKFLALIQSENGAIRKAALAALAAAPAPEAAESLVALYPKLSTTEQRSALAGLSGRKASAQVLAAALVEKKIPAEAVSFSVAERLALALRGDPSFDALTDALGPVFQEVLVLTGNQGSSTDAKIRLGKVFTVEAWVRLDQGIGDRDSLLSTPTSLDFNFANSALNVWAGKQGKIVVAKTPVAPDIWTHVAVTRDEEGRFQIYMDGELDAVSKKTVSGSFENVSVGKTIRRGRTGAAIAEFRVWDRVRTAEEIGRNFDRSLVGSKKPVGLTFYNAGGEASWGRLRGARIVATTNVPPLLTDSEAKALDAQFAKYTALAEQGGDVDQGKALSVLCTSCHVVNGEGGQIGPELSGAGAMGVEGLLRNIITPNAAMESGYRIYRVELKSDEVVDGFFVREDQEALVVRQAGVSDRRIAKADIRSTSYLRRSLMPEGLLDGLNDEQVADLMAYLMTLK